MKRFGFVLTLLLAALLLSFAGTGLAEREAGDITGSCTIAVSAHSDLLKRMTGGDYSSYWYGGSGSRVTVTVKGNKKAQGVYVSFHGTAVTLAALDQNGNEIGRSTPPFENAYIPFDTAVSKFVLVNMDETDVEISKLRVVQEGKLPSWVQIWEPLEEKADMMLVSTHPDDEILWFGGMLPTYAGELKKKVIVVYMVGGNSPKRKNELLDGLWTCGVKTYPEIGCFPDKGGSSHASVLRNWGEGAAEERVTTMLRKYQPDVVVTQDIKGEYGHLHHVVTVEAVIKAVTELSADPAYLPDTAAVYGVWTPQKLYLHLYKENRIVFDWRQPLEAFNGKTSLEVAREAFKKHVSQQNGRYSVVDAGRNDCRIFGLYYSSVGDDALHQDLFENIE